LNGTPTTLVGIMAPRISKLGAEVWRRGWIPRMRRTAAASSSSRLGSGEA
jgi:hypothetical protein